MTPHTFPPLEPAPEKWTPLPGMRAPDAGYALQEADGRDWTLLRLALCVGLAVAALSLAAGMLG